MIPWIDGVQAKAASPNEWLGHVDSSVGDCLEPHLQRAIFVIVEG